MMAALAAVLVVGCSDPTVPEVDLDSTFVDGPLTVNLGYGHYTQVDGTVLHMSFTDVLEDSRCPVDVTCVWEGNAGIAIGIGMGMGPTHRLELNTSTAPRSATWNGIRVSIVSLFPAPVSDRTPQASEYAVTLRLERE